MTLERVRLVGGAADDERRRVGAQIGRVPVDWRRCCAGVVDACEPGGSPTWAVELGDVDRMSASSLAGWRPYLVGYVVGSGPLDFAYAEAVAVEVDGLDCCSRCQGAYSGERAPEWCRCLR